MARWLGLPVGRQCHWHCTGTGSTTSSSRSSLPVTPSRRQSLCQPDSEDSGVRDSLLVRYGPLRGSEAFLIKNGF